MSQSARRAAVRTAEWIVAGSEPDREPDEGELFTALHTCAYRSARQPGDEHVPQAELNAWAERWQLIREYIFEKNLGLVYSTLDRFGSTRFDRDDLLSEAMLSLMRAVDWFNPWKGYRFSTYACNVIVRALGRLGKRESNYRQRFRAHPGVVPDRRDRSPDFRTELYVERLHRVLERNLGGLTELESQVIARRFPDDHRSRLTFREIGYTVGLSKERVRQVQKIALGKLREVLVEDPVLQGC